MPDDPQRHPPEVRRGDLIGYSCDACQAVHREVVVFRSVGDEVRVCGVCMREGLWLLGIPTATVTRSRAAPIVIDDPEEAP